MFLEQLEQRSLLAVLTWDGSANNLWSNPANWVGDVAPVAGDDLVFPAGAGSLANVNDLAAGTKFNTILIQGSGYNLTGAAIQLNGGLTANNAAGSNTFALDTTLLNAQTIMSANPGTTLTFSGPIHTGLLIGTGQVFTGNTALIFDGAGTTNATGVIDGSASLAKFGNGTLLLSGANTYDGITDVRQGVLVANNNTALGSATAGDTQIQQGAALHIQGGRTIAESIAVREGGVGYGNGTDGSTLGALRSVGGVNTITGNIDLAGGNNLIGVDSGSTLIISGVVASALSTATPNNRLLKVGDGTLQLAGTASNVYRGETRVLKGTLELNKTPGRDAVGGDLIIGDNIGGDNGATVRLLANNQIPHLNFYGVSLLTITLNSSGVLDFGGKTDMIGNLTLTTGTTYSADVNLNGGTLIFGGSTLILNGFQGSSGVSPAATIQNGTFNIGPLFSGAGGGLSKSFAINDSQLANIATDLNISASLAGPSDVSITRTGSGTLQFGGTASTWAGPFVWNNGLMEIASNNALGTGLISLQNDGGNTFKAIGNRTLGNPISIDANNTNFIGSDNLTFTGNVTLTGSRTLRVMDPAQTVTFAGVIGEGVFGTQGFVKGGRGTLALTGANTYSGTTTVNQDGGTLVLRGGGTILNSSNITVGVGGVFKIDNDTAVAGGANLADRVNDAATVTLSGKILFVSDSAANSSEYVGTITPQGSLSTTIELQKTSPAAFTSAFTTNAFGVGTDRTVNFIGTGVALSDSSAPGANRFSVANNPGGLDDAILPMGLVFGPGGAMDFATYGSSPEGFAIIPLPASAYVTDINLAGTTSNVRLSANAVVTASRSINSLLLDPGVTVTGPGATLTLNAGRLVMTANSSLGFTNLNTNGGMITVPSGSATISGNIFAGNVQKGGRGTLVLSGDSQTAGAHNVNEGILEVQTVGGLGSPAGTTTVRQGATLQFNGNFAMGLEPINVSGAGFNSNAPGSGLDTYGTSVGAFRVTGGNSSLAGTLTINGDATDLTGMYGGFPVIASGVPFIGVATGSTFTLTGDMPGASELAKIGGGTLELAGVINRGQDRNNRVLEGTMLLNNEPGQQTQRGRYLIGTDVPGAPAATLRLGGSDQITDDRGIEVFSSGLFDMNGFSDVIAEAATGIGLIVHVSPSGAGDVNIGAGGTLTVNATTQVSTVGTGNPVGATITGGTFALQVFGVISTPGQRTIQVNDGAAGDDLTITSVVADGTGLQSVGIIKTGFGTLVLGGTTPNTLSGPTEVREGTLSLNKPAGVAALPGQITIGNADPASGFAASDVLELRAANQIPDFMGTVMTITPTGKLALNGNNETFGLTDGQTALSLQAGSIVDLGGGTLKLIGNVAGSVVTGATLWTPLAPPRIMGGTLDLGNIARGIDLGGDRSEVPYELEISANLVGTAGFFTTNSGTLLLSGNNSGLSGDVFRTNGNLAVATDTAFGTGRVLINGGHLTTYGGKRTLANRFDILNTIAFVSGNGVGGSGTLGGGGNDLTFTGPVNLIAGNTNPVVATAAQVEFAGGLGETYGGANVSKFGYGTMILSSFGSFSGTTTVNTNGGALILQNQGTAPNTSFTVNVGGTLQIDNRSGANLPNRIGDLAGITLNGGTLSLVGTTGGISSEAAGQLTAGDNSNSQVQLILSPLAGGNATWRFTNYGRNANGNMLTFVARGTDIGATTGNKLIFNTAPGLSNSILSTAVLINSTGPEFASIRNPLTAAVDPYFNALEPYTAVTAPLIGGLGTFATTFTGATAASNIKLSAGQSLAGGTINANAVLMVGNGINISESAATTLQLNSNLLASYGAGSAINTTGLAWIAAVTEGLIINSGDLTINSAIAAGLTGNLSKNGPGLLTVGGAGVNAFTGITRVDEGIFRAAKATAFGTTAGNVNVAYGATVELTGGITIPAEQITLSGNGEGNAAAVPLRNLSGTNFWPGNVVLASNRTAIDVALGSTLNLDGVLSSQGFSKIGEGTMSLGGAASNTLGTQSVIWQGTVALNKTGGALAINNTSNPSVFVGDRVGADNGDRLVQLQNDQIVDVPAANNQLIQVEASGLYDLNGKTESYGTTASTNDNMVAVTLVSGGLFSGDINLNGGTLNLIAGTGGPVRSININTAVYNGGFAPSARIDNGTINLRDGANPSFADINVSDSNAIEDLIITANITGTLADGVTAGGGFDKVGSGRLVLNPSVASTYAGSTNIAGGELVARGSSSPLGTAAGNTVVGNGFSLLIDNSNSAEPLNITGVGFGGEGAVRSVSGTNTWSGDVTLAGASTVSVDDSGNPAHRLILSGAVIMGGNNFSKLLPGTLQFAGTTANTGTGTTKITEGTLELNKTPGVNAIPFRVEVGDSTTNAANNLHLTSGGQDADVMRWLASNQIADAAGVANSLVVIDASGLADLNGFNETIMGPSTATGNDLFTRWGTTQSGRVDLKGGTLTLGDGATANGQLGGGGSLGYLFTMQSPPGRYDDSVGTGQIALASNNGAWDFPDVAIMPVEVQVSARVANVGTGRILKINSSTLALTGNNSTTLVGHTTNLNGGVLMLGNGNALGDAASSLNVTAATSLLPMSGVALVDGHAVALNSDLTIRGNANVTLNGAITNTAGNRTITTNLNGPNTLTLSGTINLSNDATNRTLTVTNNTFGGGVATGVLGGDVLISGQIVNGGGSTASALSKGGVGLVTLSNNTNSYTGTTNVNAGNLRVTANGVLGGMISEQQTFGVTSTGGGSFTITYNGQTTTALNYTGTVPPTTLDLETALNALPSIARTGGVVSVQSSNPAGPTTNYTVTFGGALSGIDVTNIASINITAPVSVSTPIAVPVTGAGGTSVANTATLQVVGGLTIAEPLTLNNNGFGNFGSVRLLDLIPGTTETATWTVPVNFNANSTWAGVDGGGANPDRLVFNGTVVSGGAALIVKVGPGEMELGGATDNGQVVFNGVSPNDDGLEVRQGTVIFSKQQVGGINYNAIVGAGVVTAGDGGGGAANVDRLILSGTSLDQIGGTAPVVAGPTGLFTLAGAAVSEALPAALTLTRLGNLAGTVDSTPTRTITLGGNVAVNNAGVTTGTTPAAIIAGNLALGNNRSIDVNDSFAVNPAEDLEISAIVSGAFSLTKTLAGTLALSTSNTYTGGTVINSQTLDFNSSFNNGSNFVVLGTLVARGAGTFGTGGVTVNGGATLVLDNTAADANRIADAATLTVNSGNFTLIGNAGGTNETITGLTLGSNDNIGQANKITVNSSAGGVTVLQTAALTRNSPASAEFFGVGADLGNTSNSRIQIIGGTNPYTNAVIPWATVTGPAGYDLVADADGTAGSPYFIGRVPIYSTNINAGGIVRLNGGVHTLTADRTVDALLLENGATVTGAFSLTVGAGVGLIATPTGNNVISTTGSAVNPGVQYGTREALFLIDSGSTLNVTGNINGSGTFRKERPGTLTLSGDNDDVAGRQLSGAFNINAGTVTASSTDALGSKPGGTFTILRRAALVLDSGAAGISLGGKALTINGLGVNDDGTGALRTIGTNTVSLGAGTTAVNFNTNPAIVNVASGAILSLDANVGTGGNQIIKRGGGEMVYAGATANGSTGQLSVNEGTVTLSKTGAVLAVNGAIVVDDLGIYDGIGGGTLRYGAAGTSTDMIGNVNVTVNYPGVFDINGKTDTTTGTLTVAGGSYVNTAGGGTFQVNALTTSGGSINTGSGTLNLNGTLTYNTGLTATAGTATIAGNLNLVGAQRTFTINDGYALNEVIVDAVISNGRLVKNGNGGVLLNNSGNTFLAGINEVQRIVIAGATAGTSQFNINFNGNTTATITVDAVDANTAAAIETALRALPNVGPTGVTVTVSAALTFDITFTGQLGEQDVPNQITTTVVTAPGTFTPSTPTGGVSSIIHTSAGILSFGSNTAFGAAVIQLGNGQLLPMGGDKTIANRLSLLNNVTTTFGGRRDFGGTDDLTVTGGVTLHSSTAAGQVVNLDVNDNQVIVNFAGVMSGGGNQIVPTKRGIGTMIWSGNNTFDVRNLTLIQTQNATDGIRVEGGILRVANSNALGFSGELASVNVRADSGAVLELDGSAGDVNITGRIIEMIHQNDATHRGLFNRSSTESAHTGVLRSLAGNNSITAAEFRLRNINAAANTGTIFVGVDAGNLTINAQIVGMQNDATATIVNGKQIYKTGSGSLTYSGSTPNLLTGTTAVFSGSLVLQKAPSLNAIAGPLVVGDNVGAANSDLVILAAAEQIADGSAVTVAGSGQLQTNAAQAASLSNEVQQVFIPNVAPTGQFRLQFGAATTGDINFGATLASIQTALNALATIGGVGGSVIVQGTGSGQNQLFTVTFLGTLAGTNVSQLKIVSGTTAFGAVVPAVTTLTTGGIAGHETIGVTTLRIANQGAGNINLQPGSKLGLQGDVTVDTYIALPPGATGAVITGGTLELRQQSSTGGPANRTFTVVDVPLADDLRIDSTIADGSLGSLSALNKAGAAGTGSRLVLGGAGANSFAGSTTVSNGILQIEKSTALGTALPDEVQNYTVTAVVGAATGQYNLTFGVDTTVGLDPRATADEVAAALNALPSIGGVGGSVTVVSVSPAATNLQYFIRFGGTLAATDVAQIGTLVGGLGGGAGIGAGATTQAGGLAGIAASQTSVSAGAQLELDNVGTVINEQLTLNGVGVINGPVSQFFNNSTQAANGTGALRNIAGSNTWTGTVAGQGNVVINSNPTTIGVDAGTTLSLGAAAGVNIVSGGGSLLKVGTGVLELSGTANNTYTGNTYVSEGPLRLNKQAAAVAIDGGEVFVGDNIGGDNADVLIYAATAGTNQLGDQNVRIVSTGVLNLNGITDTNNAQYFLDVGPTASADILTGAGTLLFNNNINAHSQAGLTVASPAPTIQGTIDLQTAVRTFDIRDGGAPLELDVQALIAGGTGGVTKASRGTLALSGANTYTGTTTLGNDTGTLVANTPAAVAASAYSVGAGSTLAGTGTITGAVTFAAVAANLPVGGILAPGPTTPAPNNTGILTVNNNVTFLAGAIYLADINGTTAGTQYDQLVVGGAGTVTITGAAGPTPSNTALINGTTGNGYQPVNGVDSFRLISKASAGLISGAPNGFFLSQFLPQPPLSSPSTVLIGGKTYSTTYNTLAGLNDGNDFVLQAVATTRVWDGEGAFLATPNNNWSVGANWVGDFAPFSGDSVLFGDQGNTRESNNNDFVGYSLGAITFNKTLGAAYTLNGNAVTLNAAGGGITQTGANVTNNAVNLAGVSIATNPQTITSASTTSLLSINSPINGVQTLNLTGLGDITFNAAIGGVTPLVAIAATGVDDLTFANTIATTANVTQTAGTGLTVLSGGNVGGALTMTTENFSLAGGTLNVVGAATLTATVSNIADGNGAANNLTAPSLTATAVTGIDLDTTIVDLTATNTGAGNVTIDEANGLNILGLTVANGNAVITALGALTDGATAVTSVSGNASLTGTTITLGEAAGDAFNVGTLAFASAGAVNISEDSATQLTGTSASNSLILNSTGALTNAAAANVTVTLNAALSATSIDIGNQAGDSMNFGSLAFTSAGAVNVAEDSLTNLGGTSTALSLILSSTAGITNNAASSVTVTNNATLNSLAATLGSAAGDTINFGTVTFNMTVGGIDLTEDSSIDLLGANLTAGPVILTSPDQGIAGQNITLPLGSSLTSTLSFITLTAGDNVTLAGNVSAATTLNVDVDNSAVDAGAGGAVNVSGAVTTTGGAVFTGHADNDTFTLKPQTGSAFTVNGNQPTAFPGDVLNLDLTGTVNPLLTLGGIGSGTWTFSPPLFPVTYNSIEQVNATGANYNLILDTNTGGFGNTGVDDQILLRKSGPDFIVERTGAAIVPDNDDVGVIFQGAMAAVQSFRYIGSNDNDIVTVSDAGGLFDFASSVPGVPNNPNIAGTAEFSMDGGGGSDQLVFSLVGASAAQNYAIGNGSGAPGAEGEIETISGGVTLLSYFTNTELTRRTGSGATPGNLSVIGDLSPNTMSVVASGTATQVTAAGYTPFEFSGNNYSGVSVSGGQGTDSLTLVSIGTSQTNPLATTLNGDAAVDTLRVQSTSGNTGTVTLNGGAGNDLFQLYNAANTVDNIVGQVIVDGTDGNVAGNNDTLTIIDTGDTGPDSVRVEAVNPAVSADYLVDGITSTAGNDVIFRNIDVLDYTGTQGDDLIDARFENTVPVQDLNVVTLNGWLGADRFLLFTSDQAGGSGMGVTPNGMASGVAIVNLNGDAPGNPNLLDGNDVFGENPPPPFTGTGSGNVGLVVPDTVRSIRPSASTAINIDGGQPTGPAMPTMDTVGDVFNVDISGLPAGSALILPTVSGVVAAGGLQPLSYTQIEDINLVYNHELINVQMGDTLVVGTAGADLIQFMRNQTQGNPNLARVRVNTLVVDLTLTGKTLTFGGLSNDYITQANVDQPAEMYGEDGNDYISGAMANDYLVGGLGDDQINASGGDNVVWGDNAPSTLVPVPQDLAIGGDDFLSGLGGNDVFYGGGGNDQVSAGGGNDYANGGQGDDVLGGNDGDDRLYGGSGNDVIGGGAGNDLISGGANDDNVHGDSGADVIFGGAGIDNISGDGGNDVVITGSVANENSSFTSVQSVGNYSAATYTNPSDNDAALLNLLTQWATFGDRSSLAPITHDGVNDNVFGGLNDDAFCWEAADIADDFPAVAPQDFNSIGMGTDVRFGPT